VYNPEVLICVIDFFLFWFLNAISIWDSVASNFQNDYCMFTQRAPENESFPLNFTQYWLITVVNKFKE